MRGRILSVDYGDVRTGLALSDETQFLATGIGTYKPGGMRHTAELVASKAQENQCVLIVIGLPKNMDGSEGKRAETVKIFTNILKEYTDIPLTFFDERLTTVEAYEFMQFTGSSRKKKKKNVDSLSAEIILQDYLDNAKTK